MAWFHYQLIQGVEVPWEDEKYPPRVSIWGRVQFYNTKTQQYEPFPGLGMTDEEIAKAKAKKDGGANDRRKFRWRKEGKCLRCGADRDRGDRTECLKCRAKGPVGLMKNYWEQREQVFAHYGRFCVCCGENEPLFLALDHGPDAPSRKNNPSQKTNLTKWVVENGFPKGFRILCHNCNMATRYGRTCPHQRDIQALKAALPPQTPPKGKG